jgi:hypothetical protein
MVSPPKKGVRPGGIEIFSEKYHPDQNLIVGEGGIPLDKFLLVPLESWIESDGIILKKELKMRIHGSS